MMIINKKDILLRLMEKQNKDNQYICVFVISHLIFIYHIRNNGKHMR